MPHIATVFFGFSCVTTICAIALLVLTAKRQRLTRALRNNADDNLRAWITQPASDELEQTKKAQRRWLIALVISIVCPVVLWFAQM